MRAGTASARPAAVLFDRDGTLVVDVPYNGDPDLVQPVPGARAALDRLRAAGVPTALVSNQSGIARGLLTRAQVDAVNARLEELVGPLGPVFVCEHGPGDGEILNRALSLAHAGETDLVLLHVVDTPMTGVYGAETADRETEADERYLADVAHVLEERGYTAQTILLYGPDRAGQIVGWAELADGEGRAYLLTPNG